ncbi:MAG: hypothetical protein VKS61_12905 [Candidatus Sericytochromatia bacterium]|nr:hypothetical protein [Candidatus Sericytochromatia bacterium]
MNDELARWGLLSTLLTFEGAWDKGDGRRGGPRDLPSPAFASLLSSAAAVARRLEERVRA